ncbi:hypothetical protein CDL12_01062 [Handroanthus impetiginosus]|uniref:RIN4 pathogenic type III effector avirulence factor Avr cleavage site domain-containing protein n=1 Tax=Handroanthus impetiginosus TaxID=429701 RepID=A0A2G9I8V4_9LAMI|nr:hypothetical protein CDL12_01062 [Handroanthus impetiginosus]
MARANVPKFGNWEEDNVPYTVYFDKARKNKGGKMINPNDPQENPEMFNVDPPLPPPAKPRAKPEEPIRRQDVRRTPEHKASQEDGDFRQFGNSPARSDNMGRGSTNESNYGGRGQRSARSTRPSMGSEQSYERSPLHPHYQAKVTGRVSGSPAWDGRNHDARPRLRPTREDESPEKGTAVPRFGEWNEKDPQSAENFTNIFNKVREERNVGTGNAHSATPKHPSAATRTPPSNKHKKCCFPWW